MNAHAPIAMGDIEIDPKDLPFLPPPDKLAVVNLPPPVSVNKTRKVNWAAKPTVEKWKARADMLVMASGGVRKLGDKMPGCFEARIVIDADQYRGDLDNAAKAAIDYCKRLGLIVDDSRKYMRRVIIEWGEAPAGMRVTLREVG